MATISGEIRDSDGDLAADVVVRAYRRDTGAFLVGGVSGDGSEEVSGDSDFSSVALLLHMEGSDSSTTFTDSSWTPKTITRVGDAQIKVAQSKFGSASGYFDGSGDCLTAPSDTTWNLDGTSATVEMWVYMTNSTSRCLVSRRSSGTNGWVFEVNCFRAKINGTWSDTQITWTAPSINAWHHYALVKNGNNIKVYIDGVMAGEKTGITSIQDEALPLRIGSGATAGENYLSGYLDDIRFTAGVARYTADFTPPAAAFPDVAFVPARPLGEYTLSTAYTGEVNVVALDPDGGDTFNDLILRTTPV